MHDYHPDVTATFRTRGGLRFKTSGMIHYTSVRSLGDPMATATLVFKGLTFPDDEEGNELAGAPIDGALDLYDLCEITISDSNGKRWLDVYGVVSEFAVVLVEQSGRPEKSMQLTISGLGRALLDYQIFWHPHIASRSNFAGLGNLVRAGGNPPSGTPDVVVKRLFDIFLNDKYAFTLANGKKIQEVVRTDFEEIKDSLAVIGLSAMGSEGPLWNTLVRFADMPWNELFVDINREARSATPTVSLKMRPTPFDFPTWNKLRTKGSGYSFTYDEGDRMGAGEALRRSADGIANFVWVPSRAIFSNFDQLSNLHDKTGNLVPIYDEPSIRRYGLKRLERPTEYVQYLNASHTKQGVLTPQEVRDMKTKYPKRQDLLVKRSAQLFQWNGYPHGFYQGTITTRGRIGTDPEHGARIGGVLVSKRDEWEYYIQGIQQNWSFPGPHTTTFSVTRGHYPKDYLSWWRSILDQEPKMTIYNAPIPNVSTGYDGRPTGIA